MCNHSNEGVDEPCYFRYFLAHVFQFQIFDVLCREAGYEGPLHLCDLHGSKAAGRKLK